MTRRRRYGEVRHPHAGRGKEGVRRHFKIDAFVERDSSMDAKRGVYVSTACIDSPGLRNARCGSSTARTPSKALKGALQSLARKTTLARNRR